MKRKIQLLLLAGASVFLNACEGAADMPSCGDKRTLTGARLAIENTYISAGFPVSAGQTLVDKLPGLEEYTDEALARNMARQFKLRSVDDLRMCRAMLVENSYILVIIARNPKSINDFGYMALNIGLPAHVTVGEGWVNED